MGNPKNQITIYQRSFWRPFYILLFGSLLTISGCSTSTHVSLNGEFPTPLVSPLDLNVKMNITSEFYEYAYKEEEKDRRKLFIDLGKTQTLLLETVFTKLFQQYTSGKNASNEILDQSNNDIDLFITPELQELQYSTPRENNSKIFEIWLNYQLDIRNNQNQLIQQWPISAYGKSPSALVDSAEEGFHQAAMMALRDLGVSLSLHLPRQPQIRELLKEKPNQTPGEEK